MGSKPPNDYNQSLQELLHLKPYQPIKYGQLNLPEIFVIGLQETPNSEMIVNSLKVGIQAVLGPNYCLLRWSSVGVLHSSIWLRRELLWSCTTVNMIPVHMRPMAANRIRTKGAIALSFSLFGTSFLFINTHLTAHEINLRSRMNQLDKVQQILNLRNQSKSKSEINLATTTTGTTNSTTATTNSINNNNRNNNKKNHQQQQQQNSSEFIFWFGDLNFRLELPIDIVMDAIRRITNTNNSETKDTYLRKMMRSDQLSNLMNRGIIFNEFNEAQWPPPFLPTYKCRINHPLNDSFDSNPIDHNMDDDNIVNSYNYESGRVPSYTDRILYRTKLSSSSSANQLINGDDNDKNNVFIKCIYYNSISNIISSDHKPVYGLFEVKLDAGYYPMSKLQQSSTTSAMKHFTQLIDEIYLEKEKSNSNEQQRQKLQKQSSSSGDLTNIESMNQQQNQTKHRRNHFRRLVDRHVFKKSKSKLLNDNNSSNSNSNGNENDKILDNLDIMDMIMMNQNENESTSIANHRQWSNRIGQLNAGAYERKIYMEGMRLRNNLMQSSSMEEIRYNTTIMMNNAVNTIRMKQQKNQKLLEQNGNQNQQNQHQLFKSHSLESNHFIIMNDKNEQQQQQQQQQQSANSNSKQQQQQKSSGISKKELKNRKKENINDHNSRICCIM
uniref:Protein kinase 4-like n=1 Tax=Dermatophagoides pteronyssinus TaxID=6956 RepID=A0A6P6YMI9_DERPT|nr:protein kinase 4-like [Dermatophagoides pteronyssinus]